jgi:hypothetical protein
MEEELNIRKVYNDELRKWQGKPLTSNQESLESYQEICCGCVLLSEENLREMHRYWEITELAKTFLRFATYLEGFDHMLDKLYEPVRRMIDCVFDHPRLRLHLLRLQLVVIQRIGNLHGHELSAEEDVVAEIARYEHNIALADAGRFNEIDNKSRSGLKHDPIEWSRAYEEVIDEVSREADAALASHPRGMGFCFADWYHREQALSARGIAWKNPHIMNPRVMFD